MKIYPALKKSGCVINNIKRAILFHLSMRDPNTMTISVHVLRKSDCLHFSKQKLYLTTRSIRMGSQLMTEHTQSMVNG